MNDEQTIDAVAREAVTAALDVIDGAYLLSGHNVGLLGDSLAMVLERQVKAALFAFDERLTGVPAFTNASRVKGQVIFHDEASVAWRFLQVDRDLGFVCWEVANRQYPGGGLFFPCALLWVTECVVTAVALFQAYQAQLTRTV